MVGTVNAQVNTMQVILPGTNNKTVQQASDTVPPLTEQTLDKIMDLRARFEKQNRTYARPIPPSAHLLKLLHKDKLEMSPEAKYWLNYTPDPSTLFGDNVTFKDTVIFNPLFLPLVFRNNPQKNAGSAYTTGNILPDNLYAYHLEPDTVFKRKWKQQQFNQSMYAYMQYNYPSLFRYSARDLPHEIIQPVEIKKTLQENMPVIIEKSEAVNPDDLDAPPKFIPERKYWQSGFESVIQFSQNYISPNWYKGGTSNLNLYTRNYLRYDYKKDKVQLTNEMELKVNAYTAPKDTLRDYKMGDDLLRFHSNLGYLAFSKWYYTLDAELKTQLFKNYKENTHDLQTALFSPFSVNLGLGMKYDLDKKFKDKHKNLRLSANLAPLSFTYMYNYDDKVNLSRFGFKKKPDSDLYENSLMQFGSTVRANMAINFNRNVSWESRIYYFTNYHRVEAEFENTLRLAISRFFSTRIYLHLRFDDGVTKSQDFDSYFQVNELLSFGFNYKW